MCNIGSILTHLQAYVPSRTMEEAGVAPANIQLGCGAHLGATQCDRRIARWSTRAVKAGTLSPSFVGRSWLVAVGLDGSGAFHDRQSGAPSCSLSPKCVTLCHFRRSRTEGAHLETLLFQGDTEPWFRSVPIPLAGGPFQAEIGAHQHHEPQRPQRHRIFGLGEVSLTGSPP